MVRTGIFFVIGTTICVACIVAIRKIFEKADKPGWHALIPIYNVFELYSIAGKENLFGYGILSILSTTLFAFLGFGLLVIIGEIATGIITIMVNYSLAQNFGWRKSASLVFALNPGINYLVLGFSNDEYILNTKKKPKKYINEQVINENILNDIKKEAINNNIWISNTPNNNIKSNINTNT